MRHMNQAGTKTDRRRVVAGRRRKLRCRHNQSKEPQDRVVGRLEAIIRTKAQNPVLLKDVYSKTLDVSGDLPSTMAMWLFLEQHRAADRSQQPPAAGAPG